jgi:hypothetical protein
VKKITFIRHAKVDMDVNTPISARMLKSWENAYNSAPINQEIPQDENVHQAFTTVDYVVCSTLRRTSDSVELLGISVDESNALFNEATIPTLQGTRLKLKPTNWLVLFRILSLFGIGRWARTFKQTKEDARSATQRLLEISQEHRHIILMGHGVMNWMIRKELKKKGWKSKGKDAHGNWGVTTLQFH